MEDGAGLLTMWDSALDPAAEKQSFFLSEGPSWGS